MRTRDTIHIPVTQQIFTIMKKQSNRTPEVVIYTDGACPGKIGPGGWGAVLIFSEHANELVSDEQEFSNNRMELAGGERETTSNRMELTGAIQALEALRRQCTIDLFTDSTYVRDGTTKWLPNWKKNKWIRENKLPVRNVDLWKRLDRLNSMHDINWNWVASHSGNEGNERADKLARSAVPRKQGASSQSKKNT